MKAPAWAAALWLAAAAPSAAWGPAGHKAVAMLAESRLKPATMRAIRRLVGRNVHLDWLAGCADIFAHSETGRYVCARSIDIEGDVERSRRWHYIEIPVSERPDAASLDRFCPRGDCVVDQLEEDLRVLRDPAASTSAKRVALMYLVHFAADIHQPLHCAGNGDHGGNLASTNVVLQGSKTMSLHQVWDHAVDNRGEAAMFGSLVEAEARSLAAELARGLRESEARAWTRGEGLPRRIALESFEIAKADIYPQYAKDGGRIADAEDPRKIGRAYRDRMRPIALRRLEMAGVRLAFLLEQAFGR